jgi:hypothetical protein
MRLAAPARFAAAALLLLSGCASTTMSQTWKDPADASRPVKKVLVLGLLLPGETFDPVFENAVALQLGLRGYRVMTGSGSGQGWTSRDAERIKQFVRDNGGDLVIQLAIVPGLSSQLVSTGGHAVVSVGNVPVPTSGMSPMSGPLGSPLGPSPFMVASVPGQVNEQTRVYAAVEVFRPPDFGTAWRSMTDTEDARNREEASEVLAVALVTRLEKDGILVR